MEGTYDRRHLHRPTPRPVPNRSQMAKKPVTAHASQPASQPSVSVSASHASAQRGMDWVHKTVVKKKTIVREVPVEPIAPVVPEPVLVEPEPIEEALKGPSIAELIAAELAGAPIPTTAVVEAPTDDPAAEEPVHHVVHHHAAHAHLAGHKLSEQEREVLRRQFKDAITKETKHSSHSQVRKHVVERVRHHARKAKSPRTIIAVFLFGVILSGAYAMIDSFNINQQAHQALAEQAAAAQAQTDQQPTTTDTTATSNSTQVPGDASTAPTSKTSATYTVPADQARFIDIPKLGIHAPVISVGLTKDGAIDTPTNIWEAAWYNGSAKPDQPGASFIDAHSSASGGALFGHLDKLVNGDVIKIEKGDGTIISYKVVKVAVVDRNNIDMGAILKPYGDATKGLNLITCQGDWIQSEKTLTNRVEVWTQQQ